jgi:hypothetical protein
MLPTHNRQFFPPNHFSHFVFWGFADLGLDAVFYHTIPFPQKYARQQRPCCLTTIHLGYHSKRKTSRQTPRFSIINSIGNSYINRYQLFEFAKRNQKKIKKLLVSSTTAAPHTPRIASVHPFRALHTLSEMFSKSFIFFFRASCWCRVARAAGRDVAKVSL